MGMQVIAAFKPDELDEPDGESHRSEGEESEDEESEHDEIEYEMVYFKYCFEGIDNIQSVIDRLQGLKEFFEKLKEEGHNLVEPIDSGFCTIDKVITH
jgi:hypothetical protein